MTEVVLETLFKLKICTLILPQFVIFISRYIWRIIRKLISLRLRKYHYYLSGEWTAIDLHSKVGWCDTTGYDPQVQFDRSKYWNPACVNASHEDSKCDNVPAELMER